MDRHRQAFLVTAALATLITLTAAGCGQGLPIEIHLDTAFDQDETAAIRRAIAEWNGLCQSRLADPGPCLIEAGRVRQPFRPDAFSDGQHVIYKLETDAEWPGPPLTDDVAGYGTRADVLLKTHVYADDPVPLDWWPEQITADYLAWLEHLALHEIGHLLGLMHYDHRPGVMNKWDKSGHYEHLSEADIDQFCLAYECRPRPAEP